MMTIGELQEKWNSISPYTGGYLLVSGDHPLSFHIGYRGDEQKSFVVLNTGMLDHITSSKAIDAECIQTADQAYALRFSLNYPSLDELFIKLCWDLMDSSKHEEKPVQQLVDQYNKWLKLLQQVSGGLMSSPRQKGLIGELLYFQEVLKTNSPEEVLSAWVGPDGGDQDFDFEDHWSEVKAVSISAESVGISSLQQLDRNDAGLLVVYFMDKSTSYGTQTISLPDAVDDVRAYFSSLHELDVLNCKLAKYGYFDKDADKYSETRYRFSGKRIYQVDDAFPKMTSSVVPSAVANAQYDLSIAAIEASRIQEV